MVWLFQRSESEPFPLSGSSLVVARVIGPTRLNHARIVPMVGCTAQIVSRMLR